MDTETKIKDQTQNGGKLDRFFKAGLQYGYRRARRHPSAKAFIFGVKGRTEIFDLEQTLKKLDEASAFVKKLGESGKTILIVAGKAEARAAALEIASCLSMPVVANRFIGGTLTNFSEIRKRLEKLERLRKERESGELAKFTKRERLLIDREIADLDERFGGLLPLKEMPAALLIVDPMREHIAFEEAKQKNIPVIALCNTDCDFSRIDFAIPGNDSSIEGIKIVLSALADSYQAGKSHSATAEVK